jgi:hypothetical protein
MLAARVERRMSNKARKNSVHHLDKESPIQAVCGKAARTDLGEGRAMKRTSLPLQNTTFGTLRRPLSATVLACAAQAEEVAHKGKLK